MINWRRVRDIVWKCIKDGLVYSTRLIELIIKFSKTTTKFLQEQVEKILKAYLKESSKLWMAKLRRRNRNRKQFWRFYKRCQRSAKEGRFFKFLIRLLKDYIKQKIKKLIDWIIKFHSYTKYILYFIEFQLFGVWWLIYYTQTIYYNIIVFKSFLLILLIVLAATYLSLFERHMVAIIQQRVGPTSTGLGLIQPLADAFKLLTKEPMRTHKNHLFIFRSAPIYTFIIAITVWTVLPLSQTFIYANIKYSILFILSLLSISSFGVVFGAWASQNKYAIFSAIRTIALTNSYGIAINLIFLYPCALSKSYSLYEIIIVQQYTVWFIFPGLFIAVLFWIILITELKKIPFDVTESEAELGSGYLIEYSGMGFALFIITEYCYILILAFLFVCCFLGGWQAPISYLQFIPSIVWLNIKILICLIFYFLIRSTLPNFRYDYIMQLHWKYLFPLLFIILIFDLLITSYPTAWYLFFLQL